MRERLLTAIAVTGSCALLYFIFHLKSKKKDCVKSNNIYQGKETNFNITPSDESSLTNINQIQSKAICENIYLESVLHKENNLLEEELQDKQCTLLELGHSSTITCDKNKLVVNNEKEFSSNNIIPFENFSTVNAEMGLSDEKCIEHFPEATRSCMANCSEKELNECSPLSTSFSINHEASLSIEVNNILGCSDRLPENDNECYDIESVKEKEETIEKIQMVKSIFKEGADLSPSVQLELISVPLTTANIIPITSIGTVSETKIQDSPKDESKNINNSNKIKNVSKVKKLKRKGKDNFTNKSESQQSSSPLLNNTEPVPVKSNSGNIKVDEGPCISQSKFKGSELSVEEPIDENQNLNKDSIFSGNLEREASPEQDIGTSDSYSLVSQGSFDSGQGSIDVEPETIFCSSSLSRLKTTENYIFYQFQIPQLLVGRLIGKRGTFINKLKSTTSTTIVVLEHSNSEFKICSIEGKKSRVIKALEMVRAYFPIDQFPELTLDQINSPCSTPRHQSLINRQILQVELPPGVVAEVQASAIVSTGEIWLQQPLHPTFSALNRLHKCLSLNYGDGTSTPAVPLPIRPNTVCVCKIGTYWLRCQTLSHNNEMCTATLLDIGGIVTFPITLLRQIRVDYVGLPFQAAQSFLHGIRPNNDNGWNEEGRLALEELIKERIIFATIAAYTQEGIPLVNLYQRNHNQYIYVNEKLVELGHAKWISTIPDSNFMS